MLLPIMKKLWKRSRHVGLLILKQYRLDDLESETGWLQKYL